MTDKPALPPFDESTQCPKCGDCDIAICFCKGSIWSWECAFRQRGEHLHRQCRRCHYAWLEACRDD